MASKTESSSAGKKKESVSKKASEKSQQGPAAAAAAFESPFGESEPGMGKLSSYLEGVDEATRTRVVAQLQQTHGNSFIQRVLAQPVLAQPVLVQRQETAGDRSTQHESTDEERDQQRQNWQQWVSGAKSGVSTAVATWTSTARLVRVRVNGPVAVGGRLKGAFPSGLVSAMVTGQGAPSHVASAFAGATAGAWKGWRRRVRVPGLPWYPAFAAYPGPFAPPMPNIPSPLIAIAPGANISSGSVASSIKRSLGENAGDEGAEESIQAFAEWLSLSFTIWLVATQVNLVMGSGPVPSFAPPYIPLGPVVAGTAQSYGPCLMGGPQFGI
jgi:hypothetical protein